MKEKITEIKVNGKRKGWFSKRIPQTAQEIIDEVSEELEEKYDQLNKMEDKQNGKNRTRSTGL